jgi:exodeoxyribonuclease III
MGKKIILYHVIGIRAELDKALMKWIKINEPDIVCIRETKAQPEQIDNNLINSVGYKSYWFSALKKGYSGVGILTKQTPDHVEYGMNIEKYDQEGRLTANHINTAGGAIVPAQGKRIKAGGLITI